ncbi:MAG: nicotinate-nucleotide diphosphorylase (carboxylating), partial [Candidatus Omnitrophica bacterium]|nr:nicotinate-nucleotide diphosphorylase (carboxylating) [Candidatus Omnitrophota bacterium]
MNYADIIKQALEEDIGTGDITTRAVIPGNKIIRAAILAKEPCVVCGLSLAAAVFKAQDKNVKFKPVVREGQLIKKGRVIAYVLGRARSILSAERVALNFIALLCGIATKT